MITFNRKISSLLDEATDKAERGLPMWTGVKMFLEFLVFGDSAVNRNGSER